MLNRRYIRVKVFQGLYTYFQTEKPDLLAIEKEIFKSIDKISELYLYMLSLPMEFYRIEEEIIEQRKQKHLPTEEDLNPNLKFLNNRLINQLRTNSVFLKQLEQKKVNWINEDDVLRKIWKEIKNNEEYKEYMSNPNDSFQIDKLFVIDIFKKYIWENELIHNIFEERSIYWQDDLALVNINVVKTYQTIKKEGFEGYSFLMPVYKNMEEDITFLKDLYRKTIKHDKEFTDLISEKTKNWESDRIAKLDMLLMKMALCEMIYMKEVPIKVTLNEYIELAKNYSTPKSKVFINGVLDKLKKELIENGTIKKVGRGLLET